MSTTWRGREAIDGGAAQKPPCPPGVLYCVRIKSRAPDMPYAPTPDDELPMLLTYIQVWFGGDACNASLCFALHWGPLESGTSHANLSEPATLATKLVNSSPLHLHATCGLLLPLKTHKTHGVLLFPCNSSRSRCLVKSRRRSTSQSRRCRRRPRRLTPPG